MNQTVEKIVKLIKKYMNRSISRGEEVKEAKERIIWTFEYSKKIGYSIKEELFGDNLFTETVIVSLVVLSTTILLADFLFPSNSVQARSVYRLDLVICALLAFEFLYRTFRSSSPRIFIRNYWYEIPALIPAYIISILSLPLLAGLLRLLRLVRVYRVYRVLGRENIYLYMIVDIVREARLLQLLSVFIIGLSFTSVFTFLAEARDPNATIKTLSDAFWWSLATVTTVGYGDLVPITSMGKAIGVILMLFGIVILGGFISLTSTSVMRVLAKYQRVMKEQSLRNNYVRLRYLAANIFDLNDDEYEELLNLIKKLRANEPSYTSE